MSSIARWRCAKSYLPLLHHTQVRAITHTAATEIASLILNLI